MKCKDIVALLKAGKQPTVILSDSLWDDSWGCKGMVAKITQFNPHKAQPDEFIDLIFNFNGAREHNLSVQSHGYYIHKNGVQVGVGTAFEAGLMNDKDITENVCFEPDEEVPVAVLEDTGNSPLADYLRALPSYDKKPSYVEWLEERYCFVAKQLA